MIFFYFKSEFEQKKIYSKINRINLNYIMFFMKVFMIFDKNFTLVFIIMDKNIYRGIPQIIFF